jgi:PIN domain nuclease of toxin-antitoxin system
MRVLLDTHSFLWFMSGDEKLSSTARAILDDIENEVLVSMASLWEIAIKTSLGKISLERKFEDLIPQQLISNEIGVLPIRLQHLAVLTDLPFQHRDPFDRLIIAQAMAEELPILSRDPAFVDYPVQVFW